MQSFIINDKQDSIEVLNYQIRACKLCGLSYTRKHALTGEGNLDSSIVFVALSPGAKENVENKMFIGPSGQVFNRLLRLSGINRESVYMTNLVKCMLPKNRKPTINEIKICSQYIKEEILIISPKIIVPLGAYATKSVLSICNIDPIAAGMSFYNIVGTMISVDNKKIFPLPHPAAILYKPSFEPDTIEKYRVLKSYA